MGEYLVADDIGASVAGRSCETCDDGGRLPRLTHSLFKVPNRASSIEIHIALPQLPKKLDEISNAYSVTAGKV